MQWLKPEAGNLRGWAVMLTHMHMYEDNLPNLYRKPAVHWVLPFFAGCLLCGPSSPLKRNSAHTHDPHTHAYVLSPNNLSQEEFMNCTPSHQQQPVKNYLEENGHRPSKKRARGAHKGSPVRSQSQQRHQVHGRRLTRP